MEGTHGVRGGRRETKAYLGEEVWAGSAIPLVASTGTKLQVSPPSGLTAEATEPVEPAGAPSPTK